MTTDRELMQQALNVLKIFVDGGNSAWARKIIEIKEALRARLAQPEREWQGLTDEVNAELVEALKEVRSDIRHMLKGHFVHLKDVEEELSAAIAKATGEQQ
jgi:catalase